MWRIHIPLKKGRKSLRLIKIWGSNGPQLTCTMNGMYKHQAWLTGLTQNLLLALHCGLRRNKLQFSHSSSEALLQERRSGEGVQSWLLSHLGQDEQMFLVWGLTSALEERIENMGFPNKCSWILTCSLCYGFTVIPHFFAWEKIIKIKIKENFLLKSLPCSSTLVQP